MLSRREFYYTTISGILLLALFVVHTVYHNRVLGATALAILIIFWSVYAGAWLLPRHRPLAQFIAGTTAIGALLMIILAATYWGYRMTWQESFGALVLIGLLVIVVTKNATLPPYGYYLRRLGKQFIAHYLTTIGATVALAITILLFRHLYQQGMLDAERSPWRLIDQPLFFGGVFIAGALLWLAARRQSPALRPLHLITFFALFVSVGVLIFKIGYGFDPFVHRATEEYILAHGVITPKPLWYVGQHALVVALAHLSALPLSWIDKLLLPAAASFFLVGWLYVIAPQSWHERGLLFLLLPLASWFTTTTPQGLANLLYLILVLQLALLLRNKISWHLPILTVVATATLHPATALPALILLIAAALTRRQVRLRFVIPLATLAALLLPLLFFINEWRAGTLPTFGSVLSRAVARLTLPDISLLQNSFYAFANATYTARIITVLFAAGCTLYGIAKLKNKEWWRPYILTASILVPSAVLIYFFNELPRVIYYEQNDYVLRTLWIIGFTLLPFFWYGGRAFLDHLRTRRLSVQALVILALAAGMTTNLYLLYPRVDRVVNHRGYTTGQADLATVDFIEFQNPEGNYVVLANQSVSAAALRQLGFKYDIKTSDGSLFFYAIPTGGTLYQYYLRMVDEAPTTDVAKEVLAYTNAERVYLVLNDYWWRDYRIAEEAKKSADFWTTISGGATTVFAWEKDPARGWLMRQ
ncbi:MAG: hypothetical protein HY437_01695 [Candidatus Magasanikbacteria bacterium]|nr:hypothetical protein [Candidatus Magasanikbacteria bacterium]